MSLFIHQEGCDGIRCTCNRPKTLKELIEELEKKRQEAETKQDDDSAKHNWGLA